MEEIVRLHGILGIPEWQRMMLAFKDDVPLSQIAMQMNVTYSHALKIMKELVLKELVAREKKGRVWKMELTEKGKEAQKALCVVQEAVK